MNKQSPKVTNGVSTILRFQLFGLAITILACTVFASAVQIKLLFIGGLICILPTIVFARLIFRQAPQLTNEQKVKALAGSLYLGEFLKLLLTIALFALAFINMKVLQAPNPQPTDVLFLFAGYVVAQLSSLFGARFQQKQILASAEVERTD